MVARGKEVWHQAKCWECHGQTGKGDGEKAGGLKEDLGFPIRPADLTTGQFKSGPGVEDIFRTMTTGLSGTPMPSYQQSLPEEDRWALAYYVLSLSAFKDPLTGEPLQHPARSQGGAERSRPEGEFVGAGLCARRRTPGDGSGEFRRQCVGRAARHGACRNGEAGRPAGAAAEGT